MMKQETILDCIYAAHRQLADFEGIPHDYGTGTLLFASEIHTLIAVAQNPGCNLTGLADSMDVSKAAASKFVAKLIKSACLLKHSERGGREVFFDLTEKGNLAVSGHEAFKQEAFGPLLAVEQALPPATQREFMAYFSKLLAVLDKT